MKKLLPSLGQVTCILGAQFGDEGKGKLVDILATEYDMIARFSGGANAGHTIYMNNAETDKPKKFVAHLLPSGMLHEGKECIIGNGMVLHLPTLMDEIYELRENGIEILDRLFISERAHLIFGYHMLADEMQEAIKNEQKIGTTKRGIGPAYRDKIDRIGIRAIDLRNPQSLAHKIRMNAEALIKAYDITFDIEQEIVKAQDLAEIFAPCVIDTMIYLHTNLANGKTLLIEGAQAALLDIDHGTYPFVTSSHTTIGGALCGLALSPRSINSIIGTVKAYTTRVGSGPFPTELPTFEGDMLREKGNEYGSTTGRPRRCGWFDSKVVEYAVKLNGFDVLNITKLDVLTGIKNLKIGYKYFIDGEEIKSIPASSDDFSCLTVEYINLPGWEEDITGVDDFKKLPHNAKVYLETIEKLVGIPVKFVGVGVSRKDLIIR